MGHLGFRGAFYEAGALEFRLSGLGFRAQDITGCRVCDLGSAGLSSKLSIIPVVLALAMAAMNAGVPVRGWGFCVFFVGFPTLRFRLVL